METKLDNLTNALSVMQNMMLKLGFGQTSEWNDDDLSMPQVKSKVVKVTNNEDHGKTEIEVTNSNSETTIYQNAVEKVGTVNKETRVEVDSEITFRLNEPQVNQNEQNKQNSSLSEEQEPIDTSDELIEPDINEKFIAECEAEALRMHQRQQQQQHQLQQQQQIQERNEQINRDSEASKAHLFATPGNQNQFTNVDDSYMVIGSHVDAFTQHKIINHGYVDFVRLLPKGNKINSWDDNRMELVNKGGMTYFVPVAEREVSGITNFNQWEQAFRIFSNIYTRAYPGRSSELIQYNHIIFTASNAYLWDNVYTYDKEFRYHLSKFLQRSWAIILQQAWSMYLKDRLQGQETRSYNSFNNIGQPEQKSKEICRRFNKGKCPNGASCKYQHRCDVPSCSKYGHGGHICRKRNMGNSPGGSIQESGSNNTQK